MEQIKIGNDVKLQLSLAGDSSFYRNIKSIKCYLVNETQFDKFCNCQCSNYLLNCCGIRSYHVLPKSKTTNGFLCDRDFYRFNDCLDLFVDRTKYLAESDIDLNNDVINIYFPGKDQVCGKYKAIIVVDSYVPGWGQHEIKTSTLEYKDVVEIINDGEDSKGVISVITDDTTKDDGYIAFLPIRPYSKEEESDNNGFCRTDDNFESSDQEKYNYIGANNINLTSMTKTLDLTKQTTVRNDQDGQYLWIVSKKPIQYVYANSVSVPITNKLSDGTTDLYYYSSSNPIMANNGVNINVKFQ